MFRRIARAALVLVTATAATVVGLLPTTAASADRPSPCTVQEFWDVPISAQFCPEIAWLSEAGVTKGATDPGRFQPGFHPRDVVTRQAMAAFLHRFSFPNQGDPFCSGTVRAFIDVPEGTFCGSVEWLAGAGISTGYRNGTFKPRAPVTRQALAALLYRLANSDSTASPCASQQFWDVPTTAPFCGEIAWLASTGLTQGYPEAGHDLPGFHPQANVTRQAMAAFLFRANSTGTISTDSGIALPWIQSVYHTGGSTAGGNTVSVTGSGFTGATDVTFYSSSAVTPAVGADLSVTSDSTLTVTAPPHLAGSVAVRITTPVGTSVPSSGAWYEFLDPNAFGSITGTVTGADDLGGVDGIAVRLYAGDEFGVAVTRTGSDGSFELSPIAPGSYTVCFNARYAAGASPTGYASECLDDKPYGEPNSGTPVTVTGGTIATHVDAVLAVGGAVEGTVTDSAGPVADVTVIVVAPSGVTVGNVTTGTDGTYLVGALGTGTYQVCFQTFDGAGASTSGYLDECYDGRPGWGSGTPVEVSVGSTTSGIDATLTAGGAISGTVFDANGPVANVNVTAYDQEGTNVSSGRTDEDGAYTVRRLPTGPYFVCFAAASAQGSSGAGYLDQCYQDAPSTDPTESTSVSVTAGQVTTDIDAALHAAGQITGTVRDAAGSVSGVSIKLWSTDGDSRPGWAVTDSYGRFVARSIAAGNYHLCFDVRDASGSSATGYVPQCYQNAGPDYSRATPFSVVAGQVTDHIDALLQPSVEIRGTVTDGAGPVAGVDVTAYDENGWPVDTASFARTGADGRYVLRGIGTGTYFVCFDPSRAMGSSVTGYVAQCYDGKSGNDPTRSTPVPVTGGVVTRGINAVLVPAS